MARKRRRFTAEFKARVALEALRERDSVQAIAARHELHPNQVTTWKRQLLEGLPEVFAGGAGRKAALEHEAKIRDLHAKIGELTVERDFFGAGSSAEPGGAGADDRAGRTAESFEAVRAAGREPVVAVLPAEGGERRGPGAHAAHGRAPHGVSVLREPAADAASAPRGRCRGPAPDPAAHAPDGDGGDLPAAAHERGESGAPGLPLSAAGASRSRGRTTCGARTSPMSR